MKKNLETGSKVNNRKDIFIRDPLKKIRVPVAPKELLHAFEVTPNTLLDHVIIITACCGFRLNELTELKIRSKL